MHAKKNSNQQQIEQQKWAKQTNKNRADKNAHKKIISVHTVAFEVQRYSARWQLCEWDLITF